VLWFNNLKEYEMAKQINCISGFRQIASEYIEGIDTDQYMKVDDLLDFLANDIHDFYKDQGFYWGCDLEDYNAPSGIVFWDWMREYELEGE
jgi:hypothetical protein